MNRKFEYQSSVIGDPNKFDIFEVGEEIIVYAVRWKYVEPIIEFLCSMDEKKDEQLAYFSFAEWISSNYVRLAKCWVHRYADQTDKSLWKTTAELHKFYKENIAI